MMSRSGARLLGLVVIAGMLFFPVMSCGVIEFKGHDLASNSAPDMKGMTAGLEQLSKRVEERGRASGRLTDQDIAEIDAEVEREVPRPRGLEQAEPGVMFSGSYGWLHVVYVALLGLGGLVLLVGPVAPARGVVGLLGLASWLLFLTRFESMLLDEMGSLAKNLTWKAGAYVPLAGWVGLLLLGGFRNAREIWQTPHAADRYRGDPSRPAG